MSTYSANQLTASREATQQLLVVAGDASDCQHALELLENSRLSFEPTHVRTMAELKNKLAEQAYDLAIINYLMPELNAGECLHIIHQHLPNLPAIVISDIADITAAVELMKAGADDFVMSDNLSELGATVHSALETYRERLRQRRAEQSLMETEMRFKRTIEHSYAGYFHLDTEARIRDVNDAFLSIHGYGRADDVLGKPFAITLETESRIEFEKLLKDVLAGREIKPGEWLRSNGDGSLGVSVYSITPVISEGKVAGIDGLIFDITERHRMEEELRNYRDLLEELVKGRTSELERANEKMRNYHVELQMQNQELRESQLKLEETQRRYFDLYDLAPVGYLSLDPQGYIKQMNFAASDMLGGSRSALTDIPFSPFIDRHDQPGFLTFLQRIFDSPQKQTFEGRMVAKTGSKFWALLTGSAIQSAFDESRICLLAITDITEARQAEEQLQRSKQRLQAIFDTSNVGIAVADSTGRFSDANQSMLRMMGYNREEILGLTYRQCVDERDLDKLHRYVSMITEGKLDSFRQEVRFIHSDGQAFWGDLSATGLRDADGKVNGFFGVVVDISEQKHAEHRLLNYQHQLKGMTSELSLAEERERRRLAVELHDQIGQNLAFSRIKLGMLLQQQKGGPREGPVRDVYNMIEQIIDEVHTLTFELSPPLLSTEGLAAAVSNLAQKRLKPAGIDVEFMELGNTNPIDENIRFILYQVSRELFNNILKYADAKTVEIVISYDEDIVSLSISDDGEGFDISGLSEHLSGQGQFGLFSIKERVEYLGGTMDIESALRKGTSITIHIPLESREDF